MARIAVATAVATKDRFGGDQFPVLFDDGRKRIYLNPTGEIFVENVESGASIRIDARRDELQFTSTGEVRPTVVNGMIGWRVSRR